MFSHICRYIIKILLLMGSILIENYLHFLCKLCQSLEENKSFIRAHLHILYFHYTRVLLDFRMLTKQRCFKDFARNKNRDLFQPTISSHCY